MVKDDGEEIESLMKSFFSAWGKSDIDTIKSLSIPGVTTPRSYVGLRGEWSYSGSEVMMQNALPNSSSRLVRVSVTWTKSSLTAQNDEGTVSSADSAGNKLGETKPATGSSETNNGSKKVSQTSVYLLKINKSSGQWKILDVTGNSFYGSTFVQDKESKVPVQTGEEESQADLNNPAANSQ